MDGIFSCYSNFDEFIRKDMAGNDGAANDDKQILKTQYQILFRQWDELYQQWVNMDADRLGELLQKKAMQPAFNIEKDEKGIRPEKICWKPARIFMGVLVRFKQGI